MRKPPKKLPEIYDTLRTTQAYPLKRPLFRIDAQFDTYAPCATHVIADPHPVIIPDAIIIGLMTSG